MIRYEDVEVTYGDFTALHGLDLEIGEGEFFTLLGPSGCGKTTALRTLAGFVQPSRGEVHVDGRRVTRLPSDKRGVGLVFQNYALFPSLDVWENIAFGLKVRKTGKAERELMVRDVARRVDLTDEQLRKNLDELSGGQQQRVAIARALVLQPKILLLDEPLSNLDAKLRHQLRGQLKELQAEFGITFVYVTHDQDEALTMSDRIAIFDHGALRQVGTPQEVYRRSATEFVCTFIGDASRLGAPLVRYLGLTAGASSYLRLERPRLLGEGEPPRDGHLLEGTVTAASYHGTHTTVTADLLGSPVKVLAHDAVPPQFGQRVAVSIDPADVLQYDDGGRRLLTGPAELREATV